MHTAEQAKVQYQRRWRACHRWPRPLPVGVHRSRARSHRAARTGASAMGVLIGLSTMTAVVAWAVTGPVWMPDTPPPGPRPASSGAGGGDLGPPMLRPDPGSTTAGTRPGRGPSSALGTAVQPTPSCVTSICPAPPSLLPSLPTDVPSVPDPTELFPTEEDK